MSDASPVQLDGSQGEGGGQVLRSALALSLVTGRPLVIDRIRAGRDRPGLQRQHLTGVLAAAAIGQAEVRGAALGSQRLSFTPGGVRPGEYRFSVGTAGSVCLVAQTVLPALLIGDAPSTLWIEGGTHVPWAPTFEFLSRTYLPLVARQGPRFVATLERPGFFPNDGGRIRIEIQPAARLRPLTVLERGDVRSVRAKALVSNLPAHVGERELSRVRRVLGLRDDACALAPVAEPRGPGNAVLIEIEAAEVTEVVSAIGRRGVPAERVADEAIAETRRYLASGVPVGEHLADQLLLPLALAGGGEFRTLAPTPHTRTNLEVIRQFLPVAIDLSEESDGAWRVTVRT